jgi:hypothetical protein
MARCRRVTTVRVDADETQKRGQQEANHRALLIFQVELRDKIRGKNKISATSVIPLFENSHRAIGRAIDVDADGLLEGLASEPCGIC